MPPRNGTNSSLYISFATVEAPHQGRLQPTRHSPLEPRILSLERMKHRFVDRPLSLPNQDGDPLAAPLKYDIGCQKPGTSASNVGVWGTGVKTRNVPGETSPEFVSVMDPCLLVRMSRTS